MLFPNILVNDPDWRGVSGSVSENEGAFSGCSRPLPKMSFDAGWALAFPNTRENSPGLADGPSSGGSDRNAPDGLAGTRFLGSSGSLPGSGWLELEPGKTNTRVNAPGSFPASAGSDLGSKSFSRSSWFWSWIDTSCAFYFQCLTNLQIGVAAGRFSINHSPKKGKSRGKPTPFGLDSKVTSRIPYKPINLLPRPSAILKQAFSHIFRILGRQGTIA